MRNFKTLIVLDGTPVQDRTNDQTESIIRVATEVLSSIGAEFEIISMDDISEDSSESADPEMIMNTVDELCKKICIEDYDNVIAEGVAAWFWIRSIIDIPVICINPVMTPEDSLADVIDDFIRRSFKRLHDNRAIHTKDVICAISADVEDDDFFPEDQMIYSDEMLDSYEFWEEIAANIQTEE